MLIEVLKSKIHCARVTEANLNYMGSITIDEDLLDANRKSIAPASPRPTSTTWAASPSTKTCWTRPI